MVRHSLCFSSYGWGGLSEYGSQSNPFRRVRRFERYLGVRSDPARPDASCVPGDGTGLNPVWEAFLTVSVKMTTSHYFLVIFETAFIEGV